MQARFLLGPAGSGKTFRCLDEIRQVLASSVDGPPLILLAPKQATFQLERQLLGTDDIAGFTRLNILSFDRLARFILQELNAPPPDLLDEEGRIMVLRALLTRHRDDLRLFRASARLPGFARQLSSLFREFQRNQLRSTSLKSIWEKSSDAPETFRHKLHDFATLLGAYESWLAEHGLQDADRLLDAATEALKEVGESDRNLIKLEGLWLDGFAEMTPQELELLAATLPCADHALLAFCLESAPQSEPSWLSTWSAVGQTFRKCFQRIHEVPECETQVEILPRTSGRNRFSEGSMLGHLETHWANPSESPLANASIQVQACPDVDGEAALAARTIRQFVRNGKGRFRDCAVLLRTMDGFESTFRRTFARYGIPFFMDRRQSAAHHPLAVLTRSALRLVAFGWEDEDWFALLKTGLCSGDLDEIDWLENQSIARGWKGDFWKQPVLLPEEHEVEARAEALRSQWVGVFIRFETLLVSRPLDGVSLAAAIRTLWSELSIEDQLRAWTENPEMQLPGASSGVHATVWEQMLVWLENIERAFRGNMLPLREWLPILEAGLSNLTVGVVPPALDQVLVGTIDRSRNPELKLVVLPGMNEGIFPARPDPGVLLTDSERQRLEDYGTGLGGDMRHQIGHERFYGYIACTRAREQLILTCSQRDSEGRKINASPFLAHLRRLFPNLATVEHPSTPLPADSEHIHELAPWLVRSLSSEGEPHASMKALSEGSPAIREITRRLEHFIPSADADTLSLELTEALYTKSLHTSVSAIEQFAQCPFRFFVHSGLHAKERKLFELDARERGSFQHDVLQKFHERLTARNLRWRDITPLEARELVGQIVDELTPTHGMGVMLADDESLFTAATLKRSLQDLVEVSIGWMHSGYEFNPVAVEVEFGKPENPLGEWVIDLGDGRRMMFRGKIDRIDLAHDPEQDTTWCAVVDYKSSARQMDKTLQAGGVQIQLPAYLHALLHTTRRPAWLSTSKLRPAALAYANLRGDLGKETNRSDAFRNPEETHKAAFRPSGRLNYCALDVLDSTGNRDQFAYQPLTKEGLPNKKDAQLKIEQEFLSLLESVETSLRSMGSRIFRGEVAVDPYRKSSKSACDYCDFKGICRIDPWLHDFRRLTPITESIPE